MTNGNVFDQQLNVNFEISTREILRTSEYLDFLVVLDFRLVLRLGRSTSAKNTSKRTFGTTRLVSGTVGVQNIAKTPLTKSNTP